MKSASLPSNEKERQRALDEYKILDTLPEQDYDDITRIASEICHTPISLLTLVDHDRQWFKSKHGLDTSETPREYSFCAHTILNPFEVMVVPDTLEDIRFWDNPLTVNDPNIRFYAGAPLVTSDGFALGSLCVVDRKPNQLNEQQKKALASLANQVIRQFELRKKAMELEAIKSKLEATNQELMEATERAEKANKAKSDFLSVMSHEIRTPLHSIVGYTNLLIEETPRTDQQQPLKALQFSGEMLLSLINNILDLNKLDAGKVVLETVPLNLTDLVTNVVQANLHRASRQENRIEVVIDPALPVHVLGDPLRLHQVLNNLLSNSIKFTQNGTIRLMLQKVHSTRKDVTVHFKLTDTGIGIPAEALSTIFNEYTQASAAIARHYGGTGLGLSITQKILALYNSTIRVESEVARGTTCTFEITFRKSPGEVEVTDTLQNWDFSGFKVMVVDDSELNLKLISHSLGKKKMLYDLFSSPVQALDAIGQSSYDLILMDLQMPGMSGFSLSTEIRRIRPEVPIVALSADNSPETILLTREAGMNGFLAKPYPINQFYEVISEYLVKENQG